MAAWSDEQEYLAVLDEVLERTVCGIIIRAVRHCECSGATIFERVSPGSPLKDDENKNSQLLLSTLYATPSSGSLIGLTSVCSHDSSMRRY